MPQTGRSSTCLPITCGLCVVYVVGWVRRVGESVREWPDGPSIDTQKEKGKPGGEMDKTNSCLLRLVERAGGVVEPVLDLPHHGVEHLLHLLFVSGVCWRGKVE